MLFIAITSIAQEGEKLNDLQYNFSLKRNSLNKRNINGYYHYLIDTVNLPFVDDFSTDQFKKYNAAPTDPNVTSTMSYHLWNATNTIVEPVNAQYNNDTTYRITYDSLLVDTLTITQSALPSKQITVYNLCTFPITSSIIDVWPAYNIYDTLWVAGDVSDTVYVTTPDLVQDSAIVYTVSQGTDVSIWQDNYTCLNDRYAINPPTVGVATFDGLNENGSPYDFGGVAAPHGVADFLTSKPINMGGAVDTVYLTFYYQQQGLGNAPEDIDSLVLEYWSPDSNEWVWAWSTPGDLTNNDFQLVHLPIVDEQFKKDGFQFRFFNYANLSGNLDHWNIDYVILDQNRTYLDTIQDDAAMLYHTYSLVNDYQSVPWKHYGWNPNAFVKDTLTVYQNNNSNTGKFVSTAMDISFEGTSDLNAANPGTFNASAHAPFSTLYDFNALGFEEFDTLGRDTCAIFDVKFYHNTTPDSRRENDTTRFQQVFSNYYAYDDGSAEAAYGIYGSGAKVAYKFNIPQEDSIRSIKMHFAEFNDDLSTNLFRITIWNEVAGKPGNVIYQTDALFSESPIYTGDKNGFYEYFLKDGASDDSLRVKVPTTFYVGWEQADPEVLNIGFDRNINTSNNIFYQLSGGSWLNTSFLGSLMMRPVFVSPKDGLLSVDNYEEIEFGIYPNPANNEINISTDLNNFKVDILDITGKINLSSNNQVRLDVSNLKPGIYLVKVTDINSNSSNTQKLIIK